MGLLSTRELAGFAGQGDAVDLPRFTSLPTFTNQGGEVVARYVDPSVVERHLRSAYVEGKLPVPQPYAWNLPQSAGFAPGIDPQVVYQAWQQAQQASMPWFQETAPEGYGGYGSYAPYLFGMGGNAPVVVRRGVAGCSRCG
jgi:hypothetical protein